MEFTGQGFGIGPLFIHYYGIIIMSGVLCGGLLAGYEAKKRGYEQDTVWDLLIWLVIGGIIGARVWHILTPPPSSIEQGVTTYYYLTHPLDAIAIWKGGLGIVGAIFGGFIALYFFARKYKLDFPVWLDISAPALALGQAIGRWGNYFNQELYGAPTNLPWKIYIEPNYRFPGFENIAYYHPLFLYESLWNLANVFFLLWLNKRFGKSLKPGDIILVYLITYPLARFALEFLRLSSFSGQIAGFNANQLLMVVVIIFASFTLFWRHREGAARASVDQ